MSATAEAVEKRQFSTKTTAEFQELLGRYPTKRAALLMTLRLIEREFGSVDWGGMRLAAELLKKYSGETSAKPLLPPDPAPLPANPSGGARPIDGVDS